MPFFTEKISLDADEKIVAAIRTRTVRSLVLATPAMLILVALFLFLFPLVSLGPLGVGFFLGVAALDSLFLLSILSRWYGSVYLLTDRRLLGIHRLGIFRKKVHEVLLENINELSYDAKGVFPTLFGYGDIHCSLFTTRGSFTITAVFRPQELLSVVSRCVSSAKTARRATGETSEGCSDAENFERKILPLKQQDPPNWS